jgi:hypothetical protein
MGGIRPKRLSGASADLKPFAPPTGTGLNARTGLSNGKDSAAHLTGFAVGQRYFLRRRVGFAAGVGSARLRPRPSDFAISERLAAYSGETIG